MVTEIKFDLSDVESVSRLIVAYAKRKAGAINA